MITVECIIGMIYSITPSLRSLPSRRLYAAAEAVEPDPFAKYVIPEEEKYLELQQKTLLLVRREKKEFSERKVDSLKASETEVPPPSIPLNKYHPDQSSLEQRNNPARSPVA
jgi:hypothetical protein